MNFNFPKISPTDIPRTPELVLEEYAESLARHTNNLLKGKISSGRSGDGNVTTVFFIVAPRFNNYEYRLFTIRHQVTPLYPVTLLSNNTKECKTETDLISGLEEINARKDTIEVIKSLIAQSGTDVLDILRDSSLTGN